MVRKVDLHGAEITGSYKFFVASALIINCCLGVGSLTIPKVYGEAGLILATLFTIVAAFFSWITCEWVIEGVTIASALIRRGGAFYARQHDTKPILHGAHSEEPSQDENRFGEADASVGEKSFEPPLTPPSDSASTQGSTTLRGSQHPNPNPAVYQDTFHVTSPGSEASQGSGPTPSESNELGELGKFGNPTIQPSTTTAPTPSSTILPPTSGGTTTAKKNQTEIEGDEEEHSQNWEKKDSEDTPHPQDRYSWTEHGLVSTQDPDVPKAYDYTPAGFYTQDPFDFTMRLEYGKISEILWGRTGMWLSFVTLIIYFIGDISIYCSGMGTTMAGMIPILNKEKRGDSPEYRQDFSIWAAIYCVIVFPLGLLRLENIRVVQVIMTVLRAVCFVMMVILDFLIPSIEGIPYQDINDLVTRADPNLLPSLFGVVVYSFIAQHSLTNFIAPVTNKQKTSKYFGITYLIICLAYIVLSWPSTLTFPVGSQTCMMGVNVDPYIPCDLQSMICDNFFNLDWAGGFFAYFLGLYPAVIFIFNSLIILNSARSLTMQHIKVLMKRPKLRWFIITLVIFLIGAVIALCVGPSINTLVSFTGGVLGLFIMLVFPTLFVQLGRKYVKQYAGLDPRNNPHKSLFYGTGWIVVMWIWISFCAVLDVWNLVNIGMGK